MSKQSEVDRRAIGTRIFGGGIGWMRDRLAGRLGRLRISPTMLTFFGLGCSLLAGIFLALGAGGRFADNQGVLETAIDRGPSHQDSYEAVWRLAAAVMLVLASAFDILDGAVARYSGRSTRAGAFLDSSLDRIADAAMYIGIMVYYLRHESMPYSSVMVTATVLALFHAELISYVKARAETLIPACPVGFWQRGERNAGILIGLVSGHVATAIGLLAVTAFWTALRRMVFAVRQLRRIDSQQPLLEPWHRPQGCHRLWFWHARRGRPGYDVAVAIHILIILLVDIQAWLTGS